MAQGSTHEPVAHDDRIEMGSERSFGIVFTVVLTIVGLWPLWAWGSPRWWAFAAALLFLIPALLFPGVLRPLNRLWFRFGLLLGRIMTPVIMGVLFLAVFTPIGLLLRATGKDLLRLRLDRTAPSYWIRRETAAPSGQSMQNQY